MPKSDASQSCLCSGCECRDAPGPLEGALVKVLFALFMVTVIGHAAIHLVQGY